MEQTSHSFRCLSGSTLKMIAIVAMAIDHFAASIIFYGILPSQTYLSLGTASFSWYNIYKLCRFIGRIAFPIFCFMLVEGFVYTSNRKNYAMRLFLFALLSEIPFDLALFQRPFFWNYQNVFFTLLIGFLVLWGIDTAKKFSYKIPLQLVCLIAGSLLAYALRTDYDYRGVILIVVLYLFRFDRSYQNFFGCICLIWEPEAWVAFIPLNLYNGKRGFSMKYFFYLFYPVHLLIYGIILQMML